jgi:hypothetical protein
VFHQQQWIPFIPSWHLHESKPTLTHSAERASFVEGAATLSMTTFGMMTLWKMLQHNDYRYNDMQHNEASLRVFKCDTQHNDLHCALIFIVVLGMAECNYTKWDYTECNNK